MAAGLWRAIKRFVLWEYERATWQYDLMVGLILAFIFLTPRDWFRDQPRVPQASRISLPRGAQGEVVYWIEAELLEGVAPNDWHRKTSEILRSRDGRKVELHSVEPVMNSENEVRGYVAFTKP